MADAASEGLAAKLVPPAAAPPPVPAQPQGPPTKRRR